MAEKHWRIATLVFFVLAIAWLLAVVFLPPVTFAPYRGRSDEQRLVDASLEDARRTGYFGGYEIKLTPDDWKVIRNIPNLRQIVIESGRGVSIDDIAGLESLESLHLTQMELADGSIDDLGRNANLKKIKLARCRVSGRTICMLATLPKLETLHLDLPPEIMEDVDTRRQIVECLGKCRGVKSLRLAGFSGTELGQVRELLPDVEIKIVESE
jgi:hypothetical protein